MQEKKNWLLCKSLLGLVLLSLFGCMSVRIPNTEVCAVSGRLAMGANCANTLTDQTRQLNLGEFIDFLEPRVSPTGDVVKGPALCMSTVDFEKLKTAIEQACQLLEQRCTYEMQEAIRFANGNIDDLKRKSLRGAR